jgi:predicted peptidase
MRRVGPFLLVLLAALPCSAQDRIDGFIARVHRKGNLPAIPYRLFIPPAYDGNQKYPLILWLHGSGSIGHDNRKQISAASTLGTHIWIRPENQAKYPAFVLAPQCPEIARCWAAVFDKNLSAPLLMVIEILESLKMEFSIDPQRIYVAGQSLGGYGTWDLITKRPELFAAAIPLCGGGNTERAGRAAKVPIWAFHGDGDRSVAVTESRNMIAALKRSGGDPRYTEYRGVGHNVWERAFREPSLVEWLFAQHK